MVEITMPKLRPAPLSTTIRDAATPIVGAPRDYEPLYDLIGNARIVLLGEATHGSHEFYRERARITARLIEDFGFTIVAVEADWPDALRVNRWIQGVGDDTSAADALGSFGRFPRWMWRNRDVLSFVSWLREHNEALPGAARKVGFYGLDLYSLFGSIEAVLRYLDQVDPDAARRARFRYGCFDHYGEDSRAYGYAAAINISASCEQGAVEQLLELQHRAGELSAGAGELPGDAHFVAEQNARLVRNAEAYYRTMFRGRISSWNLRDRHMAETLGSLLLHQTLQGGPTRAVVWAHNSHIGDARATSMGRSGEWNVGQLVREQYGSDAVLVGLSTWRGTVAAASDWDGPVRRMRVQPALPGSVEALFHSARVPDFLLRIRGDEDVKEAMAETWLERAIGVVYRPETERLSHYFETRLAEQFDAVIHFDQTSAVEPLDLSQDWTQDEFPETYPSGF
jgi:erythromycin esterase-like protein